jgi:pimeloyl-ACP methyl ester carboxylesterase
MIGFKTFGSGPRKALVLHGWFGDENSFDPLLKALSPDEFTYAFVAYRGYGLSRDIEGVFDIAEASQDALALTAHLGWSRFSLIGHSMGGMA